MSTSQQGTPEQINFSTFVMGLAHATLVHLGVVEDPLSKEFKKELGAARQQIDILSVLEEKTKGNLTEEEKTLIHNILTDLRMRYLAAKESTKANNSKETKGGA